MIVRSLSLFALVTLLLNATTKADFDPDKAFAAHRDFMVGGTWISTDEQGEVVADRHVASKSKKFVRIVNVIGGTAFLNVYGIDPESGQLTLWIFGEGGEESIVKWICTAYEDDKWTWESDGSTAVVTRVGADKMTLKIEGATNIERTWTRKK